MTKQKFFYKKLFKGQWCPLFGAVPAISNNPHHDTAVAASCVDLIRDAREMWQVPQYDDWQWPNPNCPNEKIIEKITGMPGEYIVSVRKVFMKDNIVLDDRTLNRNFLENYIRSTEGASINAFIGTQTRYTDEPKKIIHTQEFMLYKVFALLSIYHAWRTLRFILHDGQKDTSRGALMGSLRAERLLKSAIESINQIDRLAAVELESHSVIMLGKRGGPKGYDKALRVIHENAKVTHERWQKMADDIRRKRPNYNLSKKAVGIIISKKTKENPDTIRRAIT